jgi:hypothetical protein
VTTGERGFAVSPAVISVDIATGKTTEGEYKVYSTASETWRMRAGVSPLSVTGENYEMDTIHFTPRNEVVRWTTLGLRGCEIEKYDGDMMYFSLQPREECWVQYRIDVPTDAPSGSQHMSFWVEDLANASELKYAGSNAGVKQNNRIGLSISANNADGESKLCGEILEQNIPFWVQKSPFETNYLIENCGNLDFYADVSLKVDSLFGRELYRSEKPERNLVFAETTRRTPIGWTEANIGIYKVTQTVKYLGETHPITKWVLLMPVWLIIVFVAIILAIIFLIVRIKSRSRKHVAGSSEQGAVSSEQ